MKGRNGDHGVDGTKGDKGEIGLQGKRGDQVGARRGSSSTRERHKDHSALSAVEGSLRCPREVVLWFTSWRSSFGQGDAGEQGPSGDTGQRGEKVKAGTELL